MPWKLILSEDTVLQPKEDIALNKSTCETAELLPVHLCVLQLDPWHEGLRNTAL